jgi:hypothetical protein
LRKPVEFKSKNRKTFKLKSCRKEKKFTAISVVITKLLYNMYTSGIYYTSGLRPFYAIARGYL